jgi:hypothetical protein
METCPLPGGLEIEFRMETVKFKSERVDALAAIGKGANTGFLTKM